MQDDNKQDNLQQPELPPEGTGPDPARGPRRSMPIIYALIVLSLVAYLVHGMMSRFNSNPSADSLTTSEFVVAVGEERVREVTYQTSDGKLTGTYWVSEDDREAKKDAVAFESYYVGADSLDELMAAHPSVKFSVDTADGELWQTILISVVPTVIMVLALLYFMNQIMGQNSRAMMFGHADALTTEETRPKTKFSDVAGVDEAVEELQEIRDFLADPERYHKMGARIPHGVLLVGPPGTGKTLLAKAVAGEAGVPFFSISGSDFVEMFVGVGASRVRDLFKQAKEMSPSIIFIDEIDAVGRQRGTGLGGGHDEREQTLNQLLVGMDGFEDSSAVILIAATNRPDVLDPALLRPGRFDRQVTVDRPDVKGREQILRVHSANKPLADDVQFENLAKLTPGFSGADLANLMNEAALLAARIGRDSIGMEQIEEAMERVMAGPERKSRVMTDKERRTIAYHESGHALVGHILDNADPVHKVTIIPRGQALGYTLSLPDEDRFLQTRNGMLDDLAVLLGGRTAEELFCEDITTGASNDLERATKLARAMVMRYGMSDELGAQVFGEAQHEVFLGRDYADRQDVSVETSKRIDDEIARIMREAHARARSILDEHRDRMDQMAAVLLERETVEGEVLDALLEGTWSEYVALHEQEDAAEPEPESEATDDTTAELPAADDTAVADAPEPTGDAATTDAPEPADDDAADVPEQADGDESAALPWLPSHESE